MTRPWLEPGTRQTPSGTRRISVLGVTGSIGASTIDILERNPDRFTVEAVTAGTNVQKLAAVARRLRARFAAIADPNALGELEAGLSGSGIEAGAGPEAVVAAAERPADVVIAAIMGAVGLRSTLAAARSGAVVALANKEALVCAGDLFIATAIEHGTQVLPVDSEHNAVFQSLETRNFADVERIILTASGGPFHGWTAARMATATRAEALAHPKWSMGEKISIDSATLMNKGLEVIEAHHLFGLPSDRIDVLVHTQSIVHGMVAYRDGSNLAQLSVPDMRVPLAHCLFWPARTDAPHKRLDLARVGTLSFEEPDRERFPALPLARAALDAGGWATNILNAANEVAVAAFLAGRIPFGRIVPLAERVLDEATRDGLAGAMVAVTDAIALDREGRRRATAALESVLV
ncbi:MAG: 1-deoxy-D-xylulose-5-phosphate reductoisomerase [Bauldia sp.]